MRSSDWWRQWQAMPHHRLRCSEQHAYWKPGVTTRDLVGGLAGKGGAILRAVEGFRLLPEAEARAEGWDSVVGMVRVHTPFGAAHS